MQRLLALPWSIRVVLMSSDADRANVRAAHRAGTRRYLSRGQLADAVLDELLEGC